FDQSRGRRSGGSCVLASGRGISKFVAIITFDENARETVTGLSRSLRRLGQFSRRRTKIPALSLQKPERQGQGTLVGKIRKKGRASPPTTRPNALQVGDSTACSRGSASPATQGLEYND